MVYDVSHNLAKLEEYVTDGRVRKLCVHREGATGAFGPGHPELLFALPPGWAAGADPWQHGSASLREGIAAAASQPKLLAEGAPYAYKGVSQVVKACEGAGLSRAVLPLLPVGVVKG